MQCLLNLTAEECNKIIRYLMEGFREKCVELDAIDDLENENDRADFDELMQLGHLIQQIATLHDDVKRKEHAGIKA